MNSRTTIIVAASPMPDLLDSEVAGRPARAHLLGRLEEFRNAKTRLLVEEPGSRGASKIDAGVLVVDRRAWFSKAALTQLLSRTGSAEEPLRVVAAGINLAVYLPAGHSRPQRLADVLRPDILPGEVVDGTALDPAQPAFLVDTHAGLAVLEKRVLLESAMEAMAHGTRVRDPRTLYIRGTLTCGAGVEIDANVIIEGEVALGDGVRVGANSIVRNSQIGNLARIHPFSLVDGARIGDRGFVGPYGRIRPDSEIGDEVQIGNFVEIKNSVVGSGSRINHHAFIGDADLATGVTIGAGTITCNHNGTTTNRTVIDRGAYIGSGCNLVAPLHIGESATVGAGSTITQDVPAAKLTLARSKQVTIAHWQGPRARRGSA